MPLPEKVVTVGLRPSRMPVAKFTSLMQELRRLVETAGGRVVSEFSQTREKPDPATLIGAGKVAEVGSQIKNFGVKTVIFDDDLTAAQQKNIEKIVGAKIVDRTRLILDIFARRARTREGQLQVELAQLNYLVPRLTGAWRGFSQQMGGIGTRGPGERKIEVERRYVRERIKRLKKEIEDIREDRGRARDSRRSVPIPQVALIGYTNVGKSTLLNTLVGDPDAVYADDKLFATLDPVTRRVRLPGGRTALFTDTVGFIQKLPHDLVAAFRATLEEVSEAALLVHLVDGAAPDRNAQQETVVEVVKSLGANKVPMITAINKADVLPRRETDRLRRLGFIPISGRTGDGVKELLELVEETLEKNLIDVTFNLPHAQHGLISEIYKTGRVVEEKSDGAGTSLHIRIDPANWKRILRQLGDGAGTS